MGSRSKGRKFDGAAWVPRERDRSSPKHPRPPKSLLPAELVRLIRRKEKQIAAAQRFIAARQRQLRRLRGLLRRRAG